MTIAIEPNVNSWRHHAECARDYPHDWWFPVGHDSLAETHTDLAKAICARCPVRAQCATWARESGEPHGIWGGLTEDERKGTLRRRSHHRGGPRQLAPCGTLAAYKRHHRHGEQPCEACKAANRREQADKEGR